jgi:hypothetical protein
MVLIGVNDFWIQPAGDASPAARLGEALWNGSRTYRLLYLLRRSLEAPPQLEIPVPTGPIGHGDATLRYGGERFEIAWHRFERARKPRHRELRAALRRNLDAIVAAARGAGTRVVLLTYPSESKEGFYGHAAEEIRATAQAAGVPLVDLGFRFRFLCPKGRCDLLLPDEHPSASGHDLAGRHLVEEARALGLLAR